MILTQASLDSVEWIRIHSMAMHFIDSRFGPDKRYTAELIWYATRGLSRYMAAATRQERAELVAYGPSGYMLGDTIEPRVLN